MGIKKPAGDVPPARELNLLPSIPAEITFLGNRTFRFLHLTHSFAGPINWNHPDLGKLWVYNLNYFEYLSQAGMSKENGLELIHDYREQASAIKDGLEPFPISLRAVNWIKFISRHRIQDRAIDHLLFQHLKQLSKCPEYHLLGNHLLENGFGLLFGAFYFRHVAWYRQAEQILLREMEEQILPDGGHFELSPMYHQLMLSRVLDSINLIRHNPGFGNTELLKLLEEKGSLMLGWLQAMIFRDGSIPRVNDSAPNIAPGAEILFAYANRLQLLPRQIRLLESGYRKFTTDTYELLMDVGQIGPDYLPGHAHSDTFNFELYYRSTPLLVDTGISTYEKNQQRQRERSTTAHNTVMVDQMEQSEVWGGFRVARRAKVIRLEETPERIVGTHNGYRRIGVLHTRTFQAEADRIIITDQLSGNRPAQAFLHFHPNVRIEWNEREKTITGPFGSIRFKHPQRIYREDYLYCTGFNQTRRASKFVIEFHEYLITKIQFR
jgi:hypothetical protein